MTAHDYPRPQLQRAQWSLLDGDWDFVEQPRSSGLPSDEAAVLDPARWDDAEQIQVPYPPESRASGIHRNVGDVIWYRREVTISVSAGSRAILHFEAVDYRADVWLNDHHLGSHEGGQTRFSFDVTRFLVQGGRQKLVVRAIDRAQDLEQPRGKQAWREQPHDIWYSRTSGIWRSVWWEEVPRSYISAVRLTSDADMNVYLDVDIAGESAEGEISVAVKHEGAEVASTMSSVRSARWSGRLTLHSPSGYVERESLLWSPERPTLLSVELTYTSAGGHTDSAHSYVGLRTVATDGTQLLLNGQPYFARLVLEQMFWPDSHLAAPSVEALLAEAQLIKSLGFNGLRVHQVAADPRFLRLCDEIGLLVWADAAAPYEFSASSLRRYVQEWMNIVERDRSHPSVVSWVPFNESWGVPRNDTEPQQRRAVEALYALISALDGSRLVMGNDGWFYSCGDMIGVHDYSQSPKIIADRYSTASQLRQFVEEGRTHGRKVSLLGSDTPQVPVWLSEFGGLSVPDNEDEWVPYGATDRNSFVDNLRALVSEVRSGALAGYCYTQLTDTMQERNGLADEHRQPKASVESLRKIFE